jgi:hypothetical protein
MVVTGVGNAANKHSVYEKKISRYLPIISGLWGLLAMAGLGGGHINWPLGQNIAVAVGPHGETAYYIKNLVKLHFSKLYCTTE